MKLRKRLLRFDQPSTTTLRTSAISTGDNKVSRLKKALLSMQIDRTLSVIQEFRLDYLHGNSLTPRLTSVQRDVGQDESYFTNPIV